MSRSSEQAYAYTGGNAYAYTGNNAYAYTGGNAYAYAYSAPMEAYGFDGYPGNPMLATAIQNTRGALRRSLFTNGLAVDGRATQAPLNAGALPSLDPVAHIGQLGAQVRSSMALLELMSSVSFTLTPGGRATLWAASRNAGADTLTELVSLRRPDKAYFVGQLDLVDSWSATRDVRLPEVLTQVAPPLAYFASLMNLQAGRHRKTLELVNVCLQFGYAVCMRFKLAMACPRPSEYTAALLPVLEVPPHASLPAGHANEAHITATVLATLAGEAAGSATHDALRQLAHRIAENRVVAGLHFPIDNIAGRMMGDSLSSYLLARANQAGQWAGAEFFIPAAAAPAAGSLTEADAALDGRSNGAGCSALTSANAPAPLPVFAQMWADAAREW